MLVHGRVADDEGMPARATRDDGERNRGWAAELFGDDPEIAPAELAQAGRYLRLCSTERLKSTWRSSLWRMNFFRRASKSGSEPRR